MRWDIKSGKFSPEEDTILRQYARTHTAQQIGDMLNRTRRSVVNRVVRLGISMIKCGENHYAVKHSDHDIELCRALYDEGMTVAEIARKMEMGTGYVSQIIHMIKRKPA